MHGHKTISHNGVNGVISRLFGTANFVPNRRGTTLFILNFFTKNTLDCKITLEDFKRIYRKLDNYQPDHWLTNQSHMNEV